MSSYHEGHEISELGKVISKGQVGSSIMLSFGVDAVHLLKDVLLNFWVERQDDDAKKDSVCGGVITYATLVSRL